MATMTAQRTIDIHSSAARPLAKPTLANAAKTTRMLTRRQKRAKTRIELSPRDKFGSCAKAESSDAGSIPALREIVAADRFVERIGVARHGWNAWAARRPRNTLRLDERTQDRQRQIRVACLD